MPTGSMLHYFWLSLGMGALSLLTPCVFPMVPITVSFFANHSSRTRAGAIRMAALYGLGIMFTFVALGMSLAIIFGAAGINKLASNPWVNLLITAIFLGFALSLLGVFFVQAPTGLMNRLNKASSEQHQGSVVGTMLMGLTFSLTSFTCTAPFVGTLLVLAAQGNWRWPLVGMSGFSFVFALPFFLLALLPQLMTQLPRAGGWMNSVKVVMGFLEIAAAMKFLSNADLVWQWNIFTRTTVLCVWIGCLLMIVAYLLGWFRFEHDSEIAAVSGTRVVFSLVFLAAAIWLANGLAGHRLGDIDAFLPPTEVDASARTQAAPRVRVRKNTMDRERSAVRFGSGQNDRPAGVHRFYGLYLHQLPVDGGERVFQACYRARHEPVRESALIHRRRWRGVLQAAGLRGPAFWNCGAAALCAAG